MASNVPNFKEPECFINPNLEELLVEALGYMESISAEATLLKPGSHCQESVLRLDQEHQEIRVITNSQDKSGGSSIAGLQGLKSRSHSPNNFYVESFIFTVKFQYGIVLNYGTVRNCVLQLIIFLIFL